MKSSFLAPLIMVLFASLPLHAASRLKGCLPEETITAATGRLAQTNWSSVSLEKLRAVWPSELSGLNCEPDVCHSVRSMDRIIAGHCECCATFAFDIVQSRGMKTEQLEEVILRYSTSDRQQLVEFAKNLVGAIGAHGIDPDRLDASDELNHDWIVTAGDRKELDAMEISFSRHGYVWELFMNWGRKPL